MICVFEILIMHSLEGILEIATWKDMIAVNIIVAICNMSSSCLMLIAGWFGIKNVIEKFIHIESMLLFWNLLSLIVDIVNDVSVGRQGLLSCFMPIQSSKNWFVTGYVYISIFALWIERMIEILSKEDFKKLLAFLLLLFSVLPTLFYFDITNTGGKGIIHLFIMYLLGRYIRKYQDDRKGHTLRVSLIALGGIIISASILNIGAEMIHMRFWFSRDCSIVMVCGAVCMLLLFANFSFQNNVVNFFAGNLLSVICGERLIDRILLKNWDLKLIAYFPGGGYYAGIIIRCMIIFASCLMIEKLRGMVFRPIEDWAISKLNQIMIKRGIDKI